MAITMNVKGAYSSPADEGKKKPAPKPAAKKKLSMPPPESAPVSDKPEQVACGSAKATVTTDNSKTGVTTFTEDMLYEVTSETPLCNVGFSAGCTRNLGDYNSFKVQISIHIPVPISGIDTAYQFGRAWVDEKMQEVLDESQV